jgi:chloramphenicol-sensitive protein RarD
MNKGILNGIGAYVLWGLLPVYWKFLYQVPAVQIIGHRIGWSFVLLIVVILLTRQWQDFRSAALTSKTIWIYSIAAVLLSLNWFV